MEALASYTIVVVDDGEQGATGQGIESIEAEYYLSTSKEEQIEGEWSNTCPTWQYGYYLWSRNKITYKNPTSVAYTEPIVSTEWEAADEVDGKVEQLREELSSSIDQSADRISLQIEEAFYNKGDVDELISSVSTELTQTKNSFEFSFNEFRTDLENYEGDTNDKFVNISKYIRFEDGNIILGESGSEMTLVQENDRISFRQNGVQVAYFTNQKLYVTDGEYVRSLKIGNFAFAPRENGSLSFG